MNKKLLSEGKRLREWYICDPLFRKSFEEEPYSAIEKLKLKQDKKELKNFIIPDEDASESECTQSYRQWLEYVHEKNNKKLLDSCFKSEKMLLFHNITENRIRLENSALRRQKGIHYFPLLFELSSGCSVQCPFCAAQAKPLSKIFEYSKENAKLFSSVLERSVELIGSAAAAGALYYASEPLDNPDYELFLRDFISITGNTPQTTTALADKYPDRIRDIIKLIGEEELMGGAIRFSVRNLEQFYRITDIYSPEELVFIELVPNNPESLHAYSAAGKAAGLKGKIKGKQFLDYSISCIAGFRVNMADKTVSFEEPVKPDKSKPDGVYCYQRASFEDENSFSELLETMIGNYIPESIKSGMNVNLSPCILVEEKDGRIILTGDGAGCRLIASDRVKELLADIRSGYIRPETVKDIQINALLQKLYRKGYLILNRS